MTTGIHRGRLLFPVTVTIRRLDTKATATAGGYDDVARETKLTATADGIGESARVNKIDIEIPCQLEQKDFFERLNAMMQGNSPMTRMHLTFHLGDLKKLGLWDESGAWGGRPALSIGDQILGFKDRYNQQLLKVPENPGLFIEEIMPTGFLTTQNLILCIVGDRAKGSRIAE